MAVWAEHMEEGQRCWTTPEFPGYDIELHTRPFPARYLVFGPDGLIDARPKFAEAEQLVKDTHAAPRGENK